MPHTPAWHILDSSFAGSDNGLTPPTRTTAANGASLQIQNLDRTDPPGYQPGGVPRSDAFNSNLFQLTPAPRMPAIPVVCSVSGFDLATSPLYWRLVCRHILCRYTNTGSYQYQSVSEPFEREWRGQSKSASFTIFGDASLTYNDASRLLGGHALLEVAAQVNGVVLADYVHLRITGANPTASTLCSFLETQLSALDGNILYMLEAVFLQESGLTQFLSTAQSSALMHFTQPFHNYNPLQPDCAVQFNWPRDPANFPLASFDFGVGISQFTEVGSQKVTPDIAWDWRENVRQAANLFLIKLRSQFTPGITWLEWAMNSWATYNGSGPRAQAYAQQVAKTPPAALISQQPVPTLPALTLLPAPPAAPSPGDWLLP